MKHTIANILILVCICAGLAIHHEGQADPGQALLGLGIAFLVVETLVSDKERADHQTRADLESAARATTPSPPAPPPEPEPAEPEDEPLLLPWPMRYDARARVELADVVSLNDGGALAQYRVRVGAFEMSGTLNIAVSRSMLERWRSTNEVPVAIAGMFSEALPPGVSATPAKKVWN